MIREILSGLVVLGCCACAAFSILDAIRAETCVAVMTPDRLGRDRTPLETFIAANKGARFGEICK